MAESTSVDRTQVTTRTPVQTSSQTADASKRVAELQVSAHLMTLETGLFCVFQTPGSTCPDSASGLPGVRIAAAPGIAGRPETVSVSTFQEDGWLNGTAALVRVTDGSAQILVTIYQHKGQDAAPRLQVLRLSGEPNALITPDPQTVAPGPAANVAALGKGVWTTKEAAAGTQVQPPTNPAIMAHVQRVGDTGCRLGQWLGVKGSRQWVEGFGIAPLAGVAPEDLEYQAILGRNWLSPWVQAGKFCGSRGMALPLLGLKVRLKGTAEKSFECRYSATFVDGSAVGPVDADEACGAQSLAALEAFQIDIQPRSKTAPTRATLKPTTLSTRSVKKPGASSRAKA